MPVDNMIDNFNIGDELKITNGDIEFKVVNLNKGLVVFETLKDSSGKIKFIELSNKLKKDFLIKNGLDTYEVDTVSEGDGSANPANMEFKTIKEKKKFCIDNNEDGECD